MKNPRISVAALALIASSFGLAPPLAAQSSFASADMALEAATALLGDNTIASADPETLWRIKDIFDGVIDDFPASDLAVQILLQDTIGKLDIAALDKRLSELPPRPAPAPEAAANADPSETDSAPPPEDPATPETDSNAVAAIAAAEAQAQQAARQAEIAAQQAAEDAAARAAAEAAAEALAEAVAAKAAAEAEARAAAERAAAAENARLAELAARERAAARAAAEEARRTATNFSPYRFNIDLRPLAIKLNACYVSARRDIYGGTQTINFAIGSNNRLEGIPELQNAENASQAGRMIYVNVTAALNTCGPFDRKYANRRYEATFNGTEITRLVYGADPEPAWVVATEDAQKDLHLERKDIAEIQARLTVLDFDPNGIDGVLGRGTRGAISAWQGASDIPVSGYLDARQLEKLREMSEAAFQRWLAADGNQAILDRAGRPRTVTRSNPRGWWRDSRGYYCRRALLGTWCQSNRPRR